MRNILFILTAGLFAGFVNAQATFDSIKLTDQLIENSWKGIEVSIPVLILGLKSQLETNGVRKEAARVFVEELQRNFTKDNFSRSYSKQIAEAFTVDEIQRLSEFHASPLALKFSKFTQSEAQGQALIQGMLKITCESSKQKLGYFDRNSISSICEKF